MVVNTIDFAAARARLAKGVALRNTYVDVDFDPAELAPPASRPTLADMLLDVARDCGWDARTVASDLRLGR